MQRKMKSGWRNRKLKNQGTKSYLKFNAQI